MWAGCSVRVGVVMARAATVLALGMLSAGLSPTIAGGWPQPVGEGQTIFTLAMDRADERFDVGGDRVLGPEFSKTESALYWEHGLTSRITLVANPVMQTVTIDTGEVVDETSGFGTSMVGARALLFRPTGKGVVSAQGGVLIPGSGENVFDEPLGEGGYGGEGRLIVGQGWSGLSSARFEGFAEVQTAWRDRAEADAAEARLDLTLGVRPTPWAQVMGQTFSTWSVNERNVQRGPYEFHKAQVSTVIGVTRDWSIQAGGYATFAGKDAVADNAAFVALWRRY